MPLKPNVDRLVGTIVAACGAVCIAYACHYFLYRHKNTKKPENIEDSYFRARNYTPEQRQAHVWHQGSCHCQGVKFNVFAPTVIHAVDVPSKLRFPRLSVGVTDVQLLCDEALISSYTLGDNEGACIGAYSFCSFCGMQVLYASFYHQEEIQVNIDCLSRAAVAEVHIAYHSAVETVSLTTTTNRIHPDLYHSNHREYGHDRHARQSSLYPTHPLTQTQNLVPPSRYPVDAQNNSEATDDLYPTTTGHYHHLHTPAKYMEDNCDSLDESLESEVMLVRGGGKSRSRRSSGLTAFSDDTSCHLSYEIATTDVPDAGPDMVKFYPNMKKYLQKHV
jgi:hypothetical protein